MAALGDRVAALALQGDDNAIALLAQSHALGAGTDRNALALEDGADLRGDVVVLARQQLRRALHDGDARAEAAIHLRELEADVAAADDHQVLGQEVHRHDGAVGEEGNVLRAGQVGNRRASADVDEYALGLEPALADRDGPWRDEARLAVDAVSYTHL